MRTLIARGLTAPALYRLLKSVYVEVARDEFRIDDAPPTDSRISLLTGVHRRDVRAILDAGDDGWEDDRRKAATFATVLGQWIAQPDYSGPDGAPLALPKSGPQTPNFEDLVRSVNTDIRPRTVLDELRRQGLVTEDGDGKLRVAEDAVVGPGSEGDKLVFFATNVGDHLAAASENLLSPAPPHFERAVFYTRLTDASLDRIEGAVRGSAQSLLEEINRQGAHAQKVDRGAADNHGRFRLGVYFYRAAGSGAPRTGQDRADADRNGD